MISYRDMTFCDGNEGKCKAFEFCPRAYTDKERKDAEKWWNPHGEEEPGGAPVAFFGNPKELNCYEE
jgi:hypothetical protein